MEKFLRSTELSPGSGVATSLFFLANETWQLYAIVPLFSAFNGLTMANQTSLISRSAEPGKQGQAMGISSSVMNLAQVPASILVGFITGSITSAMPLVVSTICIAAAGVVELVISVMALRKGVLPPTINYETPDPEIDLDVVAGEPRYGDYQYAINNSFGFGGTNGALVFKRYVA